MHLILNNLKGLGIHLVMTLFSILLILLCIVLSPIYHSQIVAILVIISLYAVYVILYLKLSCYLRLDNHTTHDYWVGTLALIIGISIWAMTFYSSHCALTYIPEDQLTYWMPYNIYIFPSWFVLYGTQNPLYLLLGSLSPALLLTMGMKIKRYHKK